MSAPGFGGKAVAGYAWRENQSVLSGSLLELYRRLDRLFLSWAADFGAREYLFPTFISARALDAVDYFRSFPHLATFPVTLDASEANLDRFGQHEPVGTDGALTLAALAPVRDVLTPAACYHFYVEFEGESLEAPRYVTTRATCFRRETHYVPLGRQWSFSMREIVCLGTAEEVKAFLEAGRARAERYLKDAGLPVEWTVATDPFFRPQRNPKRLAQLLDPVKTEMVFGGDLAIGSVNFHRNYFGEAFRIAREGQDAFSGCVAFGVERWIRAILLHFGPDERDWPPLPAPAAGEP